MKVAEFVKQQREALPPKLAEITLNDESIWSNNACYGYVIEAMENAGYSTEKTSELLHYLHSAFEFMSVEEAEEKYRKW